MKSYEEKMLETFRNIPRDSVLKIIGSAPGQYEKDQIKNEKSAGKNQIQKSKEELAVQDMRELLDYVDKKVTENLTDQDKEYVKQKADQWRKSISVLRNILLN